MYIYTDDVKKMTDQELFSLIAKYAVWYVDPHWERIQVMWAEWASGVSTILRQSTIAGVSKKINPNRQQASNDEFSDDSSNAVNAFKALRERIKHPEKETWKKAIFTLYPDGKFDMDLDYETPPMHPEFDNS